MIIRAPIVDGIYRALSAEDMAALAQFRREYETVRASEGRGSTDAAYYRALPFEDRSGRETANWRIRAASFRLFLDRVMGGYAMPAVLDLGAGNGWLTNRLAPRCRWVGAVDIVTNDADGLAAYQRFGEATNVALIESTYDRLPIDDGSIDLAVFNASLHYSAHYERTLAEALRVVRPGGSIVILDSPIYHDGSSGQAMVRDRERDFLARFGFASNSLGSEGFLTFDRLASLATTLGIRWRFERPWYGVGWAIRPLRARLRGRREPATFAVVVGTRS